MRKILLTGGTGFVGRQCLSRLAHHDFEVHAISRGAPPPDLARAAVWHAADLLDQASVERLLESVRPTHLLHLAWYAEPGRYWTAVDNFDWVRASLHLVRRFQESGGARVVCAGSCAEYRWGSEPCHEQRTPREPATTYGRCKHHLQELVDEHARSTGLSSAWGRIFFTYGPHEHTSRLVASVVRSLLREEPARCTHGRQVRDYLSVEDVAGAFVALLESDVTGPVNVGSGEGVAVRDILLTLARRLDAEELLQLGAREPRPGEPPSIVADTGRLREEVGWSPTLTLGEGLERTVAFWEARRVRQAT